MRIGRVSLIPVIAALGAAGSILAAPALAAPTMQVSAVYLHASQLGGGPGVYLHA